MTMDARKKMLQRKIAGASGCYAIYDAATIASLLFAKATTA